MASLQLHPLRLFRFPVYHRTPISHHSPRLLRRFKKPREPSRSLRQHAHPYAYFLCTPSQLLSPPLEGQPWGSNTNCGESLGSVCMGTMSNVRGCDCERCGSECPCSSLDRLEEVVRECGPSCGCDLESGNRASRRGISIRLKIARDARKGWCSFADQAIKTGQLVCECAESSSFFCVI